MMKNRKQETNEKLYKYNKFLNENNLKSDNTFEYPINDLIKC